MGCFASGRTTSFNTSIRRWARVAEEEEVEDDLALGGGGALNQNQGWRHFPAA